MEVLIRKSDLCDVMRHLGVVMVVAVSVSAGEAVHSQSMENIGAVTVTPPFAVDAEIEVEDVSDNLPPPAPSYPIDLPSALALAGARLCLKTA